MQRRINSVKKFEKHPKSIFSNIPMSLIHVSVCDGKQFNVSKNLLLQCEYFKTLFSTTVGQEATHSQIIVSCDGESFALIVRLLMYGVNAVPDASVPQHLKWILFNDANYLGLPRKYLADLTFCDDYVNTLSVAAVPQPGKRISFSLPNKHIFIESVCITVRYKEDSTYAFSMKSIKGLRMIDTYDFVSYPLRFDEDNYLTEHEIHLDCLKGDHPFEEWPLLSLEYESSLLKLSFLLIIKYREAQTFNEFFHLITRIGL